MPSKAENRKAEHICPYDMESVDEEYEEYITVRISVDGIKLWGVVDTAVLSFWIDGTK